MCPGSDLHHVGKRGKTFLLLKFASTACHPVDIGLIPFEEKQLQYVHRCIPTHTRTHTHIHTPMCACISKTNDAGLIMHKFPNNKYQAIKFPENIFDTNSYNLLYTNRICLCAYLEAVNLFHPLAFRISEHHFSQICGTTSLYEKLSVFNIWRLD